MKKIHLTVPIEWHNRRLDQFLTEVAEINTRSYAQKLLNQKHIFIGTTSFIPITKSSYKIKSEDKILIQIPDPIPLELTPVKMELEGVYEDDDLIVINKPQGLSVHPGAGNNSFTLVHGLLSHCKNLSGIGGVARPGIVHRIDKDTSGLLVVAKNDLAHQNLAQQFKEHTVNRTYIALVLGVLDPPKGTIKGYITRHDRDRKKFQTTQEHGKWAITHYNTIEAFQNRNCSLVELNLETGRTHQIRVHLTDKGNPLIGDKKYGSFRHLKYKNELLYQIHKKLPGQFLVAKTLGFVHPQSNKQMLFNLDLPSEWQAMVDEM